MIAHVVLFRPKPDLSAEAREAFVDALRRALHGIAAIKRARVGRRLTLGQVYEEHNPQEFPFFAVLEFETEATLREYLDHPAHQTLGEHFYTAAEAALAFDFELLERDRLGELLG